MCAYNVVLVVLVVLIFVVTFRAFQQRYDTTMTFFYRPECGYCTSMYNDWDAFTSLAPRTIKVRKINIGDPQWNNLVSIYGVNGVPFIVKERSGVREIYRGNRRADDLLRFAIRK